MPSERAVHLTWSGTGMRFTGQGVVPASPPVALDGDALTGPSPMLMLLLAAGSCSGSDVVSILAKMRVRLEALTVDVVGVRRDEEPRRYIEIRYRFSLRGAGLDAAKAERAVALSLEKYCSVIHSMAPDILVRHEVVIA
jgi:putative redox protein